MLFFSLIRVIAHLSIDNRLFHYASSLFNALIFIGSLFVIINLWINAFFIENRMPGTPIMQVSLPKQADYCSYRYIFFKVAKDGSVIYLCPNHYGLIPSVGRLTISPDFIATQLSLPIKKQMLLLQKKS